VSYKQAFIIELKDMHLISKARTLFLTGEAHEGEFFNEVEPVYPEAVI
jgi:hypothetical protein